MIEALFCGRECYFSAHELPPQKKPQKISLKEQLEEAIEEMEMSRCRAQNSSVKRRKNGSAGSNLVLPSFASRTPKPTVGTQYRHV
jgi:hypothetical protein